MLVRTDGDAAPGAWQPLGSEGFTPAPGAPLAAVSRTRGQVELFAQTAIGGLAWTWHS